LPRPEGWDLRAADAMSKLKVKCASCGKVFAPSNVKQTICPDCEKAQRAARAQRRADASALVQTQQPGAPLIQGPGANVLRPDTAQDEPAPQVASAGTIPDRTPAQTMESPDPQPQHPKVPALHPARRASRGRNGARRKPSQEPRAEPPSVVLTDTLRQQIEERYLALANPVEFDGIRTQIA